MLKGIATVLDYYRMAELTHPQDRPIRATLAQFAVRLQLVLCLGAALIGIQIIAMAIASGNSTATSIATIITCALLSFGPSLIRKMLGNCSTSNDIIEHQLTLNELREQLRENPYRSIQKRKRRAVPSDKSSSALIAEAERKSVRVVLSEVRASLQNSTSDFDDLASRVAYLQHYVEAVSEQERDRSMESERQLREYILNLRDRLNAMSSAVEQIISESAGDRTAVEPRKPR